MEERRSSSSRRSEDSADWNKISKTWIIVCQMIVIAFLLGLVVVVSYTSIDFPYNIFVIGIEVALSFMGVFMVIKSNTIRRHRRRQNNSYR
jgi:hypothetical protein